jgi:8-amino-7-oxononanoate synthase
VFHVTRLGSLAYLNDELLKLADAKLLREPVSQPPGALSFSSNDYLARAQALTEGARAGAGASRLLGGECREHLELEARLADWLGLESSLTFSSGYAANVGTIAALADPNDLIVSDELNHASLIDGARLSRARVVVTRHNDLAAVARALHGRAEDRAWVLVESYYSMDADGPDLRELRRVCDAAKAALLVDEAHALGVLGPGGRGRLAEADVTADVLVGTLGKAFGSQGAFVAGEKVLREWLFNRARSFVFSTGLAPSSAEAAIQSLEYLRASPDLPGLVRANADRLRAGLGSLVPAGTVLGFGHIVPVVLGEPERALAVSAHLLEHGLFVPAVRPPTVPAGTARLRFTVTAGHSEDDVDRALAAFGASLR